MANSMKALRFGVEIETVGVSREACAQAMATALGGAVVRDGGSYDKWACVDAQGRKWTAMSDGSLCSENGLSAEVVSPILTWSDISDTTPGAGDCTLSKVVRALRAIGATANNSCGIHVHVGVESFDAAALTRLARLVYSREAQIQRALRILPSRLTYCGSMDGRFANRIVRTRFNSRDALMRAWYDSGSSDRRTNHYDNSRYTGLNLHSVWYRGTAEFRWFNGTTHAGEVRAYVHLALALAARALDSKKGATSKHEARAEEDRYDFRNFLLLQLGLAGDEFKASREHLTKNLSGGAWAGRRQEVA
jgi:hypothetical protein